VFNAIPLPVEPSRFLAIFNRYSMTRYVIAISLGRFVRYFLLATQGEAFRISNGVLITLTVVLIQTPMLISMESSQVGIPIRTEEPVIPVPDIGAVADTLGSPTVVRIGNVVVVIVQSLPEPAGGQPVLAYRVMDEDQAPSGIGRIWIASLDASYNH
jgi:hypothetical protein